VDIVLYCTAVG